MATKRCCCGCPLDVRPWRTAKLEFMGMIFEVEFPEIPDEDCCQREVSICKDIGEPQFFADCYLDSAFGWTLYNPEQYLSTSGPFCDWPLVVLPFTAVDSCCNSSNYRIEWRGRNRFRFWLWRQAFVKFTICYCKTEDGRPGYRMRIEINWRITMIQNLSRLIKYRHRKYTRVCCPTDDPGDGGDPGDEEPEIP
jgi:hypothetical protein